MLLWIDDVRPAPLGYVWCRSVNEAKSAIREFEEMIDGAIDDGLLSACVDLDTIEVIDIDHDAGDFVNDGGDYIRLLDWLEETDRYYPIHIHSMNPVGIQNMRAIIQRNHWKEI